MPWPSPTLFPPFYPDLPAATTVEVDRPMSLLLAGRAPALVLGARSPTMALAGHDPMLTLARHEPEAILDG